MGYSRQIRPGQGLIGSLWRIVPPMDSDRPAKPLHEQASWPLVVAASMLIGGFMALDFVGDPRAVIVATMFWSAGAFLALATWKSLAQKSSRGRATHL